MTTRHFLAVDLGATSGRTIVGTLSQGRFSMCELTRFDNRLLTAGNHVYWDLPTLYAEVLNGLAEAARRNIAIESIGIDTWGVDFVLFDSDGTPLGNPLAYRDPHTAGIQSRYFNKVLDKDTVYQTTGIQFMDFNTLFQLYALREAGNELLDRADKLLFMPDALAYMLTGQAVCEYTIASTSQLLNAHTGDLDTRLLAGLDLERSHFAPMVQPGTVIGTLTPTVQAQTGLGNIPVVAVAGHDTGSAVAAVPATGNGFAYLSSGTWSLMGIETAAPVISAESYALNFTNEGGIEGTTRFLKNICGMWIYERCRAEWGEAVAGLSHAELCRQAMEAEGFRSIINPDDARFANPPSMLQAIAAFCAESGQPVPATPGEVCRCIFDSLALRYRQVFRWLQRFSDTPIEVLHVIGGGSRNSLLNRFTASSCGVTVVAGPMECTALGNLLMQAKAVGEVTTREEMRNLIVRSVETETFLPEPDERWDRAYERFLTLVK